MKKPDYAESFLKVKHPNYKEFEGYGCYKYESNDETQNLQGSGAGRGIFLSLYAYGFVHYSTPPKHAGGDKF